MKTPAVIRYERAAYVNRILADAGFDGVGFRSGAPPATPTRGAFGASVVNRGKKAYFARLAKMEAAGFSPPRR